MGTFISTPTPMRCAICSGWPPGWIPWCWASRRSIDASHANSSKNPENQPKVIADINAQLANGEERIVGVMVESHLVAGRQDLVDDQPLTYGQSITDGCIGWDSSLAVLESLAEAVRARRAARISEAA